MLLLGAIFAVLLMSASVYTYNVLTDETLIAEIRFEPLGEQRYTAYLRTGDLCDERALEVLGDQWRIDARFLKWRYWALLLGLDSQYRLERFEGRYADIQDQNSRPAHAYDVASETLLDVVAVSETLGPLNFLVDATYGTSTYEDIDPNRVYLVYKSPTGLFTRSRAPLPAPRDDDALAVEVTRACGGTDGIWYRAAAWTDRTLGRIFGRDAETALR